MKKVFLCITIPILLSGCVSSYSMRKTAFENEFNQGNFSQASVSLITEEERNNKAYKDEFFMGINAGLASLYCQDYQNSAEFLDVSERAVDEDNTDGYPVKYYEKIMINTYKALAFWQSGDLDNAKVEFNRAYNRQAQAVEENKKQISKLQEEMAEKEAERESVKKSIVSAQKDIDERYPEFKAFKAYSDFANPYTSYISGLFLATSGNSKSDREDAVNYLKRVSKMSPNNKYVKQDVKMAEQIANGKKAPSAVWVVYENGLNPTVSKETFTIPFYLGSGVKVAQMSLPKLNPQNTVFENLEVTTGKKTVKTQTVADMDRVILTEFKQRFPWEVTKAVTWMTVNLIAQEASQKALKDQDPLVKALAAVAISQISNPVEIRSWTTLPKDIQIARLDMPKNKSITIKNALGTPIAENLDLGKDTKQALVYVRIPTAQAVPSISVTKIK